MNGFASHGLDEDAFGEKRGNIVQAFDAFRTSVFQTLSQISFPNSQLDWSEWHRLTVSQPKQSPNM
jgi:hypothetical protein